MKSRVVILQDKISKGGRFSVVARIISRLNAYGIVPDIFTGSIDFDLDITKEIYGFEIDANIKDYKSYNRHWPEHHLLSFNKKMTAEVVDYDWVINSSNTAHFLQHNNLTDYVHFPRLKRVLSGESLKNRTTLVWVVKKLENLYVKRLYNISDYPDCSILVNSIFTKEVFLSLYNNVNDIEVIYPPIQIPKATKFNTKSKSVINLGRFHPSKKQHEIIKIAKKLPSYTFHIAGFVTKGDSYYQECKLLMESEEIDNVYLYPNVSVEERDDLLDQANYFLHMLHDEPFGISTVQGIAQGCIPIVPNSGGQREIVSERVLRFEHKEEIPNILEELDSYDLNDLVELQGKLFEHIHKFSTSEFDKKFNQVIEKHVAK